MDEVNTIVTTTSALPLVTSELTVTLHNPVLLSAGEYADQGQPDVLLHLAHAVDEGGYDIREALARKLAQPFASALLELAAERAEGRA